jgi:hypothetical protein
MERCDWFGWLCPQYRPGELHPFAGITATQSTFKRPIVQGTRQAANHRDRNQRPDGKLPRLMIFANSANHRATFAMTCIQHPSQLVVFLQEGVRLIDKQCRPGHLDDAKHCCRGCIGGRERPRNKACENIQQRGLTALSLRLYGHILAHSCISCSLVC